MADSISKMQILVRSELALFRIQAKRMATQTGLRTIALFFALLALGMLTFAGYQALAKPLGSVIAALIVAFVDGAFALLLLFLSQNTKGYAEQEKMIREVRELAYKEISADLDEAKAGIDQVTKDVKRIHDNIAIIVRGSSALVSSVTPMLSLLVAALKKNREKES